MTVDNSSQFHLTINFNGLGHVNSLQNFKEHISSLISLGKLSTEHTKKERLIIHNNNIKTPIATNPSISHTACFFKRRQASLFIINKRDLSSKYKSIILIAKEKTKIQSKATTKAKKQIPNIRDQAKQNHNRRNQNTKHNEKFLP